MEEEIMDLLHRLEVELILNQFASQHKSLDGNVELGATLESLLMLLEDHIHHELHLVQPFLIIGFVVLLFVMNQRESRERVSALVVAADQDSPLGCATHPAALHDVGVKLLYVDSVLRLRFLL
jgi:hypothetical protein